MSKHNLLNTPAEVLETVKKIIEDQDAKSADDAIFQDAPQNDEVDAELPEDHMPGDEAMYQAADDSDRKKPGETGDAGVTESEATFSVGDSVVYTNDRGEKFVGRVAQQVRAQTYKVKLNRTGQTKEIRASQLKSGNSLKESHSTPFGPEPKLNDNEDELHLFADNDGQIYRQYRNPTEKKLQKLYDAGKYTRAVGAKEYARVAKEGLAQYKRQIDSSFNLPSSSVQKVADYFAWTQEVEMDAGNRFESVDHSLKEAAKDFVPLKDVKDKDITLGMDVHHTGLNKTGMLYGKPKNGKVDVRFPSGKQTVDVADLQVVLGEDDFNPWKNPDDERSYEDQEKERQGQNPDDVDLWTYNTGEDTPNESYIRESGHASLEPSSAVGQRLHAEFPKTIDVVKDSSRYGEGYRLLITFPNARPMLLPDTGRESAKTKADLIALCPADWLEMCVPAIDLAFSTPHEEPAFSGAELPDKIVNVVTGLPESKE